MDESSIARYFFFGYTLGEALIETAIFVLGAYLIQTYLHKYIFKLFIAFTFIFLLAITIDFIMSRLTDTSVWYWLELTHREKVDNFIEMVLLSGIPMYVWAALVASIIGLPLLGVALYYITHRFSMRKPVFISPKQITKTVFCGMVVLLIGESFTSPFLSSRLYRIYQQALPWKTTLLTPKPFSLRFSSQLRPPKNEGNVLKKLALLKPKEAKKKNIFLFVIESLRSDVIQQGTSPNIYQFQQDNYISGLTFSNANATHLSWFTIFHSEHPYYWKGDFVKNWEIGSVPLKMMRDSGYNIYTYAATSLCYYNMDETIFGENSYLMTKKHEFLHYDTQEAHESDLKAIEKLNFDVPIIAKEHEANLFIIFLDSTHFQYSWPDEPEYTKFTPYANKMDFVKIIYNGESIGRIKNRYYNSVYYVDYLIGKFINSLKENDLFDESFIIITGDHGEELLEKGKLFHASNLHKEQISVPIIYKLPFSSKKQLINHDLSSHIDIFPTIIDYLYEAPSYLSFLEGQSLFKTQTWPYVITSRYNASLSPYELMISNKKCKILAHLHNRYDLEKVSGLEVMDIMDLDDNPFDKKFTKSGLKELISNEFGKAFPKLFPDSK